MFDRSFDRSKDYFVALQLLRVMDEWIDEIVLSVKELREHPMVEHLPLCAAEANNNFDATIKNMKERAEVVQKRIRKKQEEINSLRDGVCPFSPIPKDEIANAVYSCSTLRLCARLQRPCR
jgi:hypothetical protein